jgi:S-disulfanyl-L-cysteine oxidoreductase SoxD
MRKYTLTSVFGAIIIACLVATGCSAPQGPSSAPAAPPPPSTVAQPATPPVSQPPAVQGIPAGALADAGQSVYAQNCASCHGDVGQGTFRTPALVGFNAHLERYGTAQGLFDYVSKQMPLGKGGTLSREDYLRLVVLCLVKNSYVTPSTPVTADQLAAIKLTK